MEYDSEDFEELNKLRKDDLVIAIMGPTGTGKSNIIDILTGQLWKRARGGIQSCTTVVSAVRIKNHPKYGDRIVLVDTPGLSNTHKSDLEILRIISDWLIKLCKVRVFLCGIMYLQRITDTRMSGSHQRSLSMLGELCGTCAVKKVTLVTTMWDEIEPNDPDFGKKREGGLKSTYWKPLLDHGASTARCWNTESSAWDLIGHILAKPVENIILHLQEELVSLGRPLEETEAAKRLEFPGSMGDNLRTQEPKPIPKKKLQESPVSLFSEIRGLKLPVGQRLLKTFASAFRITRRQAKEFQENDKGNAGKETGVLFANNGKKDSERKRSVIDKERMNLPGREIEGVTRVNEINGPSTELQSDAFKKDFFVGQETGRNYSEQIGELESHAIGNTKHSDIMALSGDDIIIAIMGLTGTGKSNFIDHLTGMAGKPGKRAGDTMRSCTSDVGAIRIENHPKYKNRLVVVDTPGFDDTNRSDTEILAIIDQWLIQLYKSNIFLHGVIYTHRITDTRLSGAHCRSLEMFAELCREKVVNNVLFVMTMWDEVLGAKTELEEEREQHLKKEWSSVFERDACTARFYNTSESAWDILETMVENMAFSS